MMKRVFYIVIFCLLLPVCINAHGMEDVTLPKPLSVSKTDGVLYGQEFSSLQKLIERRMPILKNKVTFQKLHADVDSATYRARRGRLVIEASSVSAAAVALNDYIKKYCNSSISHTGDNIQIPAKLPSTNNTVRLGTSFPIRYALNYCTYNYTMSFWRWEEWEKELDWMVLNGVNLMLAPMGTEEVWVETLKEFGYDDKSIRNFIPGPAFNAWWLMGNLEGWGGPVSDDMIQHWTALQKKILLRMRELGIQPVMQGFWGMVPNDLKYKYPNAKIIDQGKWVGGFERPAVLLSEDSLFTKIADVYYKHLKMLYGTDFKYFGGDLFHEGGKSEGLNVGKIAQHVQLNMQKHFPGSTWVLQGWLGNPSVELLQGLDRSKTLILDLMGDGSENWKSRNGYEKFPWLWCTITNFGERTIMEGKLARMLTEPQRAKSSVQGESMKGVGIIPEGIKNNAVIYEWLLQAAWQKGQPDLTGQIEAYIRSRYGKSDPHLSKAWQFLLQSLYMTHSKDFAGGYESVLCARPEENVVHSTSTWAPKEMIYDPEILEQAAQEFTRAATAFEKVATYRYDLVDIWRQLIAVRARQVYNGLMQDYKNRDKAAFLSKKAQFVDLLLLQDRWTGTHPDFRVGGWLQQARNMLPGEQNMQLAEWNARTQITYWGADNPGTDLHEYAHKEWNGILKDLYLPRWEAFFKYALLKMENKEATMPDFFSMEKQWAESQNTYSSQAEGDPIIMLPEVIKILKIYR